MSTPLVATKLYVPPPRPNRVQRPRLFAQLNEGLHCKLTLVAAPAGFGKTTLLGEWLTTCALPVAWLSLEKSEDDLTRFLSYLVAALQTLSPTLGQAAAGLLLAPQPPPLDVVLTSLLNDINANAQESILVLDDYHVLRAPAIDSALDFLITHLPPHLHLVIASREDPDLSLARLRARGQLLELRANDLRFTPPEAAAFLADVMGLALSTEDVLTLEERTEGWIAGLQLVALSLQRHNDAASFIRSFRGSHRFVLDYLVEEVLRTQPEHIQTFLLRTSILDRLCGSLCNAILGIGDQGSGFGTASLISDPRSLTPDSYSQIILVDLERANMFLVPLDDERRWFRYHHLFAEVLQTHLMEKQPALVPTLHRRASDWYEQNGLRAEAIRHAFAGKDFERAAELIELAWPALRKSRQEATFGAWMKALPDELFDTRPVLSLGSAWALLDGGELDAAEARLRAAEHWLDATAIHGKMIVVDEKQFRSLPASIANARAYRAQARDDIPGTVRYARQALDLLPEDDYYERGTTAALLGLAYWASGNLLAAYDSFSAGLDELGRGGGVLIVIGGARILGEIRVAQGRLRDAMRLYQEALQLATSHGTTVLPGAAELYLGMSELWCEWGDLDAARAFLAEGEALREQASLPGNDYTWPIAHARLKQIGGDFDGALAHLGEAERLFYKSPIPNVQPISAMRARLWLAAGRFAEAEEWARQRNLSPAGELDYLREYEHVTLARILLARYRREGYERLLDTLVVFLDRLLAAAEAGGRTATMLEISVLLALAYGAGGNIPAALGPLKRALSLAEPEGYVRIFADEGAPMAALLDAAAQHSIAPDYVRKLRTEFGTPTATTRAANDLHEPLSERELEVLRLLGTEQSGPEIARQLMISLNTLRTHTKNIYGKLGVNNRRAAVRRAQDLNLV